jgi:hypothetical protein
MPVLCGAYNFYEIVKLFTHEAYSHLDWKAKFFGSTETLKKHTASDRRVNRDIFV